MGEPKKGTVYKYRTGKYVREKLGSTKGVKDYRVVPVKGKPSEKILIGITDKKGPRGGKTKAISLLRPASSPKGRALAKKAKIKEEKRK